MSTLFHKVWLRTNTYVDNLSPGQRRRVRGLCEQFFTTGYKLANGDSIEENPSPTLLYRLAEIEKLVGRSKFLFDSEKAAEERRQQVLSLIKEIQREL